MLGFLGPNGAGKSTTMRMVTGFLPPTSGDARICGISIVDQPEEAKTQDRLPPGIRPALQRHDASPASCASAPTSAASPGRAKTEAVEHAIETCFLQTVARQSIDTLSKGYRHRTCLAQALLHDPEVLILDEPTDGLDPNQKHEVRNLIRRLGKDKAILFSTHILEEVDAACTRAVIVDRGRIVADGTPEELRAQSGTGSLQDLFRQVTTRDTDEAGATRGRTRRAKPGNGQETQSESPPVPSNQHFNTISVYHEKHLHHLQTRAGELLLPARPPTRSS